MHWLEDLLSPEERPTRHWTEFLENSDESRDRNDDWEWDRQDDLGDSWDHEDEITLRNLLKIVKTGKISQLPFDEFYRFLVFREPFFIFASIVADLF